MAGEYAGRPLWLPFPVDAQHMSDIAQLASVSVRASTGSPLNFEPSSVPDIDQYLGEIAAEVGGSDELAELVLKLGAYIGELMVRHAGGEWVAPPAEIGPGWPVVLLPSGYYATPVDRAFKRVENGVEDSIVTFRDFTVPATRGASLKPWTRWWHRR